MPKSEKRFARQHIYEPPPGFLLASPCSGIVHHLSVTIGVASADQWPACIETLDVSSPGRVHLLDSQRRWTPWSVFQDGWRAARPERSPGPRPRRGGGLPSLRGRDPRFSSAHEHRSTATISYTLHSLFRVLFNFPSRYLFSIGLAHVFSFGWDSPPTWDCDLKQSDSSTRPERCAGIRGDGALTLSGSNFQSHLPPDGARDHAKTTTREARF